MQYIKYRVTMIFLEGITEVVDYDNSTLRFVLKSIPGMVNVFDHGRLISVTVTER